MSFRCHTRFFLWPHPFWQTTVIMNWICRYVLVHPRPESIADGHPMWQPSEQLHYGLDHGFWPCSFCGTPLVAQSSAETLDPISCLGIPSSVFQRKYLYGLVGQPGMPGGHRLHFPGGIHVGLGSCSWITVSTGPNLWKYPVYILFFPGLPPWMDDGTAPFPAFSHMPKDYDTMTALFHHCGGEGVCV